MPGRIFASAWLSAPPLRCTLPSVSKASCPNDRATSTVPSVQLSATTTTRSGGRVCSSSAASVAGSERSSSWAGTRIVMRTGSCPRRAGSVQRGSTVWSARRSGLRKVRTSAAASKVIAPAATTTIASSAATMRPVGGTEYCTRTSRPAIVTETGCGCSWDPVAKPATAPTSAASVTTAPTTSTTTARPRLSMRVPGISGRVSRLHARSPFELGPVPTVGPVSLAGGCKIPGPG